MTPYTLIIITIVALISTSCSSTKILVAMNKSTDRFIVLESDKRILYERGAKADAKTIAKKLDTAIESVEKKQYKKFTKPVTVYICDSIKSFTSYCVYSQASGCVLNERLFLSPKNFQADRQALTHELSHLHIEQQLGMFTWHSGYPAWFQEGLATYVSDGEGANTVSPDEARKAIIDGKTFTPNISGSLIFKKTAHSFGLTPNMFYRQASMFVKYLHDIDKVKFKTFLLSVESGKNFDKSFSLVYGNSIKEVWNEFIQDQRKLRYFRIGYATNFKLIKGNSMSRKCQISGKGPMTGNNVSHAQNKTKRRFLPNLRTVRITLEDGTKKKIKVSAKELRTMRKKANQ